MELIILQLPKKAILKLLTMLIAKRAMWLLIKHALHALIHGTTFNNSKSF